MLYTYLTKKAMKIAFEAHKNQKDKTGLPYILHPVHLAEQMDDEASICVALLHDVVEDTEVTLEQLAAEGFTNGIIAAVAAMTHDDAVPYMDYVREIKKNPVARKVKLADLCHNSDLSRLDFVDERALERVCKYAEAIKILSE